MQPLHKNKTMEILSPEQIRLCDLQYLDYKGVESVDLMENAAIALKNELLSRFSKESVFQILCGTGNNGGDGLALARLLKAEGYGVEVEIFRFSDKASKDFSINYDRLQKVGASINEYESSNDFFLYPGAIIVDALFGVGLSRPLEGEWLTIIQKVNDGDNKVVSIDVPSGLLCEAFPSLQVIEADLTLTFERPKLCFFLKESAAFIGELKILPIGLNQKFIGSFKDNETIELSTVKLLHKKREKFGHKGTYGHALIIAGSEGKMGAAVLASKSCINGGAGLVTAIVPGKGLNIIQTAVPEVMAFPGGEGYEIEYITSLEQFDAVGVGPGLGTFKKAEKLLSQILKLVSSPLVLDADALNAIAQDSALKTRLLHRSAVGLETVLTPHPLEAARLLDCSVEEVQRDRLASAQELAQNTQCVVVLKGSGTVIAAPGQTPGINPSGHPRLACAGTGDVLAGLLGAALARGLLASPAAQWAVYHHGRAASNWPDGLAFSAEGLARHLHL